MGGVRGRGKGRGEEGRRGGKGKRGWLIKTKDGLRGE
jgi:hypothetical protein